MLRKILGIIGLGLFFLAILSLMARDPSFIPLGMAGGILIWIAGTGQNQSESQYIEPSSQGATMSTGSASDRKCSRCGGLNSNPGPYCPSCTAIFYQAQQRQFGRR